MRAPALPRASSMQRPSCLRARRSAAACLPRKLARLVAGTQEALAGGASVASALADLFPRDLAPLIDMSGKRWAHTARRPPRARLRARAPARVRVAASSPASREQPRARSESLLRRWHHWGTPMGRAVARLAPDRACTAGYPSLLMAGPRCAARDQRERRRPPRGQAVVKLPFADVARLAAAAQQDAPDERELTPAEEVRARRARALGRTGLLVQFLM